MHVVPDQVRLGCSTAAHHLGPASARRGLVRDGYRLACQCAVTAAEPVQIAPAVDERSFQILGGERLPARRHPVTLDAGIDKQVVQVTSPKTASPDSEPRGALAARRRLRRRRVRRHLETLPHLPTAKARSPSPASAAGFLAVEAGDTALSSSASPSTSARRAW